MAHKILILAAALNRSGGIFVDAKSRLFDGDSSLFDWRGDPSAGR